MTDTLPRRELSAVVAGCTVRATSGGDATPLVVLDHSIADRRWHAVHDALAADFTVHALDLPGFNGADRPAWGRDVRDLAALVGGYVRKVVGGPVVLVGSEFGGWVAAELAAFAPELVTHLALVGPGGLLPTDGAIADMMLVSHSGYARQCFSSDAAFDACFADGLTDERLLTWDRNREMVARVAWKPYMYNRRLAPMLAEITRPAVVVQGTADRVMPRSCAEQYVAGLPEARLHLVEGAGNAVALERPDAVAAAVGALVRG
jgi:pimeloyl-ACP methyl ester carboxylesterase